MFIGTLVFTMDENVATRKYLGLHYTISLHHTERLIRYPHMGGDPGVIV